MKLLDQTNGAVEGIILLPPSCDVLYTSPRATQQITQLTISPTGDPPSDAGISEAWQRTHMQCNAYDFLSGKDIVRAGPGSAESV